jgi:hypothetical protein
MQEVIRNAGPTTLTETATETDQTTTETEMNLRSSLLLLVAAALVSCDKKRVFDEYHAVGKSWDKDSVVSFELPKLDTKNNTTCF